MSEGANGTPTQNGAYMYYDATGNNFKIATGAASLTDRLTIARDTGNAAFTSNVAVTGNVTVAGTSSTFNTGNSGTFVTNDANNYPRLTMTSASAQLGLFRAGDGGMYIGASSSGFRLYTTGFSQKLLVDQSGNATFSGTVTATKLISTGGVLDLDDNGNADGVINARASLTINIDSDANSTGEVLRINSNTTGVNTNNLFNITETGATSITGGTVSSGSTVLDVQGTAGQLFSVTNSLTGDLFSVSDVSGVPILNVNSSGVVEAEEIKVGSSQQIQIYHDGSNSHINEIGTGSLILSSAGPEVQIKGSSNVEYMARFFTNAGVKLYYNNSETLTVINGGVNITGTMTASSDVVAFSDERLKTNIKTLDGSKVYEMRGVSFNKDNKEGSGVIAQELEKIAPELVNNDSEYKAVAYGNITGYLIEAVKELKAEIEELKKQIK